MSAEVSHPTEQKRRWILYGIVGLFIFELIAIGALFKHSLDFICLANWPRQACAGPSGSLISIFCICAALALFAVLFPAPFERLFDAMGKRKWLLGINLMGVAITLTPLTFLVEGSGTTFLIPAFACWVIGMCAMLAGLMLYLAPFGHWVELVRNDFWRILLLVAGGASAPILATAIRPIWQLDAVASTTFAAVAYLVNLLGFEADVFPEARVIGADNFFIDIAPVCSGIEGIALVSIFVSLYLFLFRTELRFPRALILYPIGIVVSATLNIVRIVVLLIIGLKGNPELAVGGFHSHAGWLMFTIVSLGIIMAANTVGWLRKSDDAYGAVASPPLVPFFQDPIVALTLPFACFMFSALLAQVLSETPGAIYPARAVMMLGILLLFLPIYRKFEWLLDPVAIGAGVAIGLMWVLIPVSEPSTQPPYGTLSGTILFLWFLARGVGTTFLVPVIEEMFFRGYLEQKLKRNDTLPWAIGAAVIGAGLFAMLHGRWAEAFVASLVFSYVMHRKGRVTDAIVCHGVANALIFAIAVITQKMHII